MLRCIYFKKSDQNKPEVRRIRKVGSGGVKNCTAIFSHSYGPKLQKNANNFPLHKKSSGITFRHTVKVIVW